MYPVLLSFAGVVIPSWHVLFALGGIAGYFLLLYLGKRHLPEISEQQMNMLFICTYIGGYLGARSLSIIVEEADVHTPWQFIMALFRLGPMTYYGGALGSFLAGYLYCLSQGLDRNRIADAGILCGVLGLAIGRIGCFLNGDDFGIPVPFDFESGVPWYAVTFPNHNHPVPRYPVQLIESGFAFLVVLIFCRWFKSIRARTFPGAIAALVVAAYAVFRFYIEAWRDDFRGHLLFDFWSTSQTISVILLLTVCIYLIWRQSSRAS